MRTTIKDVAKLAGVSTATVSMVLNNRPVSISDSTKEIVRKCAQQLNYRPNRLAYGMATKNSHIIGLILPNHLNEFFNDLSRHINTAADAAGYTVLTAASNSTPKKDLELLNLLINHGVDGIIMACANIAKDHIPLYEKALNASPIPILNLDRQFANTRTSSVLVNNRLGGYLATRHLIDYGHTRIGCITGPIVLPGCRARLQGYRDALEKANLDYNESLIYQGKYDVQTGQAALSYLLGKNVSSVFVFDDMIAMGLYQEALLYNIRIPDDISIVGFDDVFFAALVNPPLTTVSQPIDTIAHSLVNRMTQLIQYDDLVLEPEIIDPLLKVRGSTRRI